MHDIDRFTHGAPAAEIGRPLRLYQCAVDPNWIDYNGHMTEGSYLTAFGDASDALFRFVGIDEAYRAAGYSFYTVETHINYYLEARNGESLDITTQLLGLDAKRLHIFHTMVNELTGERLATTEQMLVHVATRTASAAPMQPDVHAALEAILAAHVTMPLPTQVGRRISMKHKN